VVLIYPDEMTKAAEGLAVFHELSPKIQVVELASERVTVRHSRFDLADGCNHICIRHVFAHDIVLVDPEDAVVVGVLKM
jgi:hypothetical protein